MKVIDKNFDRNKSILKDVYIRFEALDPGELDDVYMASDQQAMKTGNWDYNNKNLIANQIKEAIESVGLENISNEKEKLWIKNILWMWYHHAVSCALSHYGDKELAKQYSAIALDLQPKDHPNKITRLLYLLVRDDIEGAKQWFESITTEPEHGTALHIIGEYEQGIFFKKKGSSF